jgi:ubiquitin carboxyl-terminal hydrolase 4/11/15
MRVGQVWFVLDFHWWMAWTRHTLFRTDAPGGSPEDCGNDKPPLLLPKGNRHMTELSLEEPGPAVAVFKDVYENPMAASDPGIAAGGASAFAPLEQAGGPSPGPINNAILQSTSFKGDLKQGLIEGEDFVLVPEAAYVMLEGWYGGGPRFPRSVIQRGSASKEIMVELYPIRIRIYRCKQDGSAEEQHASLLLASRSHTMSQVRKNVLARLGVSDHTHARISICIKEEPDEGGRDPASTLAHPRPMRHRSTSLSVSEEKASARLAEGEEGWMEVEHGSPGEHEGGPGVLQQAPPSPSEWRLVEAKDAATTLDTVLGDDAGLAISALVETREQDGQPYPRDHILNAWRLALKPGDFVDAMDAEGDWFESYVVAAPDLPASDVQIHFMGWAEKWEAPMDRMSPKLQPLHSKTKDWRAALGIGSEVEVSFVEEGTDEQVKRWYKGKVVRVKSEDSNSLLVECSLTTQPAPKLKWVQRMEEEICCMGTHVKDPHAAQLHLSPSASSWYKRSNRPGPPAEPGAVGLSNLGNTCFMNSMLQCLSHTAPWTKYFLSDEWLHDLNEDNPLGMQGRIAMGYAALMKEIWGGEFSVVSPQDFKRAIGQFAPQFAGFSQQDSQELMIFLLDGLHEGLNRVRSKPYVENFYSNGGEVGDGAVAEECWRRYLLRNDSAFVDTHHGLLRSHVTCPNCEFESTTYDAYTCLQLPLPVQSTRVVNILLVPLPCGSRPRRISLRLPDSATVSDLKEALRTGSAPQAKGRLEVADVWNNQIYKVMTDKESIRDIKASDRTAVYELEHEDGPGVRAVQVIFYSMASFGQRQHVGLPFYFTHDGMTKNCDVHDAMRRHCQSFAKLCLEKTGDQSEREGGAGTAALGPSLGDIAAADAAPTEPDVDASVPMVTDDGGEGDPFSAETFRILVQGSSVPTHLRTITEVPCDDEIFAGVGEGGSLAVDLPRFLEVPADNMDSSSMYDGSWNDSDNSESVDLSSCFEKFVEKEELGPTEQWYCSRCKGHYQAFKKFDIWTTPDVLIVQLKRFHYVQTTYSAHREKVDALVTFPVEGLDLRPFLERAGAPIHEEAPPIYDLYAVSEHIGGLRGGHYTSVARNGLDGKWFSYNDSMVSETNAQSAVTPQAYVLFYQRRRGVLRWGGMMADGHMF